MNGSYSTNADDKSDRVETETLNSIKFSLLIFLHAQHGDP